ncbi:VTT domain-containing protein [Candidatus Uhrbacteria bacterium]|nr:VTT domain-containing protein [Candidatus Uhrbacteria bacterium]
MFDLITLIKTVGYIGLFGIIFAESGLFIGFFLPGDSLLFTAGFLASQGYLNIWILMIVTCIGAITGDSIGYTFGRKVGPSLFRREDSLFFHKDHIGRAQRFYEHHGKKTIVLARFVPIVRTFAPILAGVGSMHYPTFLFYNVIGGILWTIGLSALGYTLGAMIPNIDHYLLPIVLAIIALSMLPNVIALARDPALRARLHARLFARK